MPDLPISRRLHDGIPVLWCLLLVMTILPAAWAETVLDPTRIGPQRTAVLTQVLERMRLRLWSAEVIADNGIPSGWRSFSGGLHLRSMSIIPPAVDWWVLPPDWIGIRQPGSDSDDYTLIRRHDLLIVIGAPIDQQRLHGLLSELLPGSPSDEHAAQVDAHRTPEQSAASDHMAQDLVARFCPDPANIRAAIDSLNDLRIPAHTVFADGVRSDDPAVVQSAIAALGDLGGTPAVNLLLPELLRAEDAPRDVNRKRSTARALLQIADPTSGPALLANLAQVHDEEARMDVAETLERIEYRPAGDALLALCSQASRPYPRGRYAKILASLRHEAAIPLLRQLCGDAGITGATLTGLIRPSVLGDNLDHRPEIALLRLTAPWGPAADGVRLLLVPFPHTTIRRDCRIALLIENQSTEDRSATGFLSGGMITIDGVPHVAAPSNVEGCFTFSHHGTWLEVIDLSRFITTPGTYRISYRTGRAVSNAVQLDIAAPPGPRPRR